jgi:hypothetical protein
LQRNWRADSQGEREEEMSCIFTREEFRKLGYERWKEHLKICEYCRNYQPKKYYSYVGGKPDFLTKDMV